MLPITGDARSKLLAKGAFPFATGTGLFLSMLRLVQLFGLLQKCSNMYFSGFGFRPAHAGFQVKGPHGSRWGWQRGHALLRRHLSMTSFGCEGALRARDQAPGRAHFTPRPGVPSGRSSSTLSKVSASADSLDGGGGRTREPACAAVHARLAYVVACMNALRDMRFCADT